MRKEITTSTTTSTSTTSRQQQNNLIIKNKWFYYHYYSNIIRTPFNAALSTILFLLICFLCAGILLHPLGLKKTFIGREILVVRKVDYNEYMEENYIQTIEFIVLLILAYYYSNRITSSGSNSTFVKSDEKCRIKAIFFISWVYCFAMESILQITGHRKMDLLLYARNKPKSIVYILSYLTKTHNTTSPSSSSLVVAKVFAISFQAYAEGAIYNTKSYMYGTWLRIATTSTATVYQRGRGFVLLTCMICFKMCFMMLHYYPSRYIYGWPRPIIYGTDDVLGKRGLLSSLSFRIPHCYAIYYILAKSNNKKKQSSSSSSSTDSSIRKIWIYMAMVQILIAIYFFSMLEYLGRSYMERENGTALPFGWNIVVHLFRCFEVLSDGAAHFFVVQMATDWFTTTKMEHIQKKE